MKLTVNAANIHGSVNAIASKSMAHRLLICASLSADASTVRCENLSDDINATAACLKKMGNHLTYAGGRFYINRGERPARCTVDCSESGSTLRFLLPVLGALGINARIEMKGRLPQRPLSPLYGELCTHGCSLSPEGSNPLIISGKLRGGIYNLRADISSQFISGLLFALPLCREDSRIVLTGKRESAAYIEMTLSALRAFGIVIKESADGFEIAGNQKYRSPGELSVEGDWSNAAFWLSAAAMGAPVSVAGLSEDSLQGDRNITAALEAIRGDGKTAMIDASGIPDLVPILAVVAAATEKTTVIYNASRLRLKESDRIESTLALLRAIGATAVACEDGLRIKGDPVKLKSGGTVDSCNDHRIAMAAAIASYKAGNITILGADAVRKSYPSFWEDFRRLGGAAR